MGDQNNNINNNQHLEMDGNSDYEEENSSQISGTFSHTTGKRQYADDAHRSKTSETAIHNRKKNLNKLASRQAPPQAETEISNREMRKIQKQIERLEKNTPCSLDKGRKKAQKQQSEKKSPRSDSSVETEQQKTEKEVVSTFQISSQTNSASSGKMNNGQLQVSSNGIETNNGIYRQTGNNPYLSSSQLLQIKRNDGNSDFIGSLQTGNNQSSNGAKRQSSHISSSGQLGGSGTKIYIPYQLTGVPLKGVNMGSSIQNQLNGNLNNGTVSSQNNGTVSSQNNGTVSSQNNGTVSSQNNGTVSSQNNGTVSSQNNGTVSSQNNVAASSQSNGSSQPSNSLQISSNQNQQQGNGCFSSNSKELFCTSGQPVGLIVTEDDSEVSASCEQLEFVEDNVRNQNQSHLSGNMNGCQSGSGNSLNGGKSKKRYLRKQKDAMSGSLLQSSQAPVISSESNNNIEVISTMSEGKANGIKSGVLRNIQTSVQSSQAGTSGNGSSAALITLIHRRPSIPSSSGLECQTPTAESNKMITIQQSAGSNVIFLHRKSVDDGQNFLHNNLLNSHEENSAQVVDVPFNHTTALPPFSSVSIRSQAQVSVQGQNQTQGSQQVNTQHIHPSHVNLQALPFTLPSTHNMITLPHVSDDTPNEDSNIKPRKKKKNAKHLAKQEAHHLQQQYQYSGQVPQIPIQVQMNDAQNVQPDSPIPMKKQASNVLLSSGNMLNRTSASHPILTSSDYAISSQESNHSHHEITNQQVSSSQFGIETTNSSANQQKKLIMNDEQQQQQQQRFLQQKTQRSARKNDSEYKSRLKRGPLNLNTFEDQPNLFLRLSDYQEHQKRERDELIEVQVEEGAAESTHSQNGSTNMIQTTALFVPQTPPSASNFLIPSSSKPLFLFKNEKENKEDLLHIIEQPENSNNNKEEQKLESKLDSRFDSSYLKKLESSLMIDKTLIVQENILKKFKNSQQYPDGFKEIFSGLHSDFAQTYLDPSYCNTVLSFFNRQQQFCKSFQKDDSQIEY